MCMTPCRSRSFRRCSKPLRARLAPALAEPSVLVLDNAGWHGEAGLHVPDGVRPVLLLLSRCT